jgi:hypothetical protein
MSSTVPTLQADNAGLPTLGQVVANPLFNIFGSCPNGPSGEFKQLLNDATQRLLYRGDWMGTVLPIQATVERGVVTFPRIVGSVRHVNICHRGIPVYGPWYSFLSHYWSGGNCCGAWQGWLGGRTHFTQFGRGVQFSAIPTATCVLKVYSIADDDGQVIQFFGLDPSGNPLRTDNGDGTWSDGISITLGSPSVIDTNLVASISRVLKPATQGAIQVSAWDTTLLVETPIAAFDPSDTNPSFAQYKLHTPACTTPVQIQSIALVKLQFIPVVASTDPILIPNLHALSLFMQSIRFEQAGDRANAKAYQIDAVRELNLQLDDDQPDYQVPIRVNPFGTASPSRAGIGRVI